MDKNRVARIGVAMFLALVVMIVLLGFVAASGNDDSKLLENRVENHPGTPVALVSYRLPFDRGQKSVITNGPGEGEHINRSGEAIDFSPRGWTNVYAAKSGTVFINNSFPTTFGNLLVIEHEDGLYTYYAHLESPTVDEDDVVGQGEVIGTVGCTGNCTGTHLHFEARDVVTYSNPVNTGDSREHSARRIRGIGWYPWYPNANSNSGFTIRGLPPHIANLCVNNGSITMDWLAHNQFTHTQSESYSWSIVRKVAEATPPAVVNAAHDISQGTSNFAVPTDPRKYFIHLRVYDSTNNEWASQDEIAHQGPFKIGSGCPASWPAYTDSVPVNESDDEVP